MTLRLSVVSEHGIRLGQNSSKLFGVHGGTIGRATDNAWILPDPERYLSGKHARVDFRAGTYVLVDTSSNGTYVNGSQVPLGKYHDYMLKDGDYVRLGEYELLVSIDKSNDFPPDQGAIVAYDGQSGSSAVKKSTANDLGADLDLSLLLEPSVRTEGESGVRPRNAYGQAVTADREGGSINPENSGTPWHMLTRPITVGGKAAEVPAGAAPIGGPAGLGPAGLAPSGLAPSGYAPTGSGPSASAPRPQNPALYDGDFDLGLAAFCRGAGVDPRSISSETRNTALQLAGQLLREAVLGLMDLNQGRNEFRNRFRMSLPPAAEGPDSPLNLSRGVDEALVRLLTTSSTRAGSVEAIRDNFRELKAQNVATVAASRAAFEDFIGRVDPKGLEERFDRATKRGVFGNQNKGKYWDLYSEMFAGLTQRPADGFPHAYIETFVKAYETKLRAALPPRRNVFGGEDDERGGGQQPGDDALAAGDL